MSPSAKTIWHQSLAILPVAYIELSMGFAFGWLAPVLKSLESPDSVLPLTSDEASWIASLHELGRIFGPFLSATLMDTVGRTPVLAICAFIPFAIWFGVLFTKSVPILYAIRFVFGVGVGMCDVVSSIYIAENCLPQIRGVFCSVTVVFFYSGLLCQFVIGSYLSYDTVAVINLINGFIGVLCSIFLTEPVQFLLMKNKTKRAQKNFVYLKGNSDWDIINTEFDIIRKNVENEEKKRQSLKELFTTPNNRKSIIVVFILNILTMATGYGAVMAYITKILPSWRSFTSYEFTISFGIVQLIACFVSLFIIDRLNRRCLLKFLFFIIGVIHLWTAITYYRYETAPSSLHPWFLFGGLAAFAFMYGLLDPVIHITRGELFPQSVKAIGGCLAIMAHASMGFLTTKLFLIIADNYGIEYNFAIFSAVGFIAFVFTNYTLPEARARTLVDVQEGDMSAKSKRSESDDSGGCSCCAIFANCFA